MGRASYSLHVKFPVWGGVGAECAGRSMLVKALWLGWRWGAYSRIQVWVRPSSEKPM